MGNIGNDWCKSCLKKVCNQHTQQTNDFQYVDAVYSMAKYIEGVRTIIHDIKFNDKKGAVEKLAPFYMNFDLIKDWNEFDIVIPVPISDKKRKARGYNQVDILFKSWILNKGLFYKDILIKLEHTKPMYDLTKEERIKNIESAYIFKYKKYKKYISNKNILIVDDIFTTGSTIEVISKLLKENGAKKITALTLAGGAVDYL